MDTCIASSISQRTAYILKTLGQSRTFDTDPYGKQKDYGTFSSRMSQARAFVETELSAATSSNKAESKTTVTPSTTSNAKSIRSQASTNTARQTKRPNNIAVKSNSLNSSARSSVSKCTKGKSQELPPTDAGGGGCRPQIPTNLPHYDTFYTPKYYQPVSMFNLGHATTLLQNCNNAMAASTSYCPGDFNPAKIDNLHVPVNDPKFQGTSSAQRICTRGTSKINPAVEESTSCCDPYCRFPYGQKNSFDALAVRQGNDTLSVKESDRENKTRAVKSKSAAVQPKNSANNATRVKKGSVQKPDLNNNFYKGKPGIFFACYGSEGKSDETGQARINFLAQPKRYPCPHRKYDLQSQCGVMSADPPLVINFLSRKNN
ncbi:hypothetical protein PoB_006874900 [Plakobranchus ocellatus]|uniref:Uncharacterized protein n=1 Tax=Plakobranchus ocellatus TaxID=259542 RepID=A0AAV4DDG4_9GAST|nr:hypothetical protein PoB_006874900 [Plakobranchus ocellatus]